MDSQDCPGIQALYFKTMQIFPYNICWSWKHCSCASPIELTIAAVLLLTLLSEPSSSWQSQCTSSSIEHGSHLLVMLHGGSRHFFHLAQSKCACILHGNAYHLMLSCAALPCRLPVSSSLKDLYWNETITSHQDGSK